MTSNSQHGDNTQPVWKLIEQDYTLRLSLVANDWSAEHLKAWNAVFAEGKRRGNAAYYGPALVEMEIADAEKRAEWAYKTCCEIWEIQGRSKGKAFFRAILEFCLQPMFSVREGCFRHDLELHQKRRGKQIPQDMSAIGGHMKRQMGKLRARWSTILTIAGRDAENEMRLKQEQGYGVQVTHEPQERAELRRASEQRQQYTFVVDPSASGGPGASFTWRELEIRFQEIQARCTPIENVYAWLIRTEWHTGAITEHWMLGGNLDLQTEYESLGSIAAQKLGYAPNESSYKNWLGRVREWMRKTRLESDKSFVWASTGSFQDKSVSGTTQSLRSERIAELSAKFCMALMARGTPEMAVLRQADQTLAAMQAEPNRAKRRLSKTRKQSRRTAVIFGAIQSRLKGSKYCKALDDRGLRPPDHWTEEGCPRTYAQAYKEQKWRIRIQNEKYRFGKQYDVTTIREREAIIQSLEITRRTRA